MTSANRYLTWWEPTGTPGEIFWTPTPLMRPNKIWRCSKTMPTHGFR